MRPVSRRRLLGVVATVAIAAPLAFATSPAVGTADFEFERIQGADRYATAANIALETFNSASTAVIARGDDFPDALAGSYIAGQEGAPVLLVTRDTVPPVTAAALEELEVTRVIVLGGTAAISDAVFNALDEDYEADRVFGTNRYATAAAIAEEFPGSEVGEIEGGRGAIVASGQGFADALAAGPIAYAENIPVLLTPSTSLAAETAATLDELGIDEVVIVGGTAAVSDDVEDDIADKGIGVTRIFGANRFETAAAIADYALDELGFDDTHVNLARGIDQSNLSQGFADALAGAPHAGEEESVIVLTDSAALSGATGEWLTERSDTLDDGHIFGGTAAVSLATEQAATAAAKNVAGEVVFVDTDEDTYSYVPAGSDDVLTINYIVGADGDDFEVDGNPATPGSFEANINPGDQIRVVHGDTVTHQLDNVAASAINNRMIGNIDNSVAPDETVSYLFDFINEVSGDAIREDVDFSEGAAFFDGEDELSDADAFAAELNEGDVVEITTTEDGQVFTLSQGSIEGTPNNISKSETTLPPGDPSAVEFRIGPFGDQTDAAPPDDGIQSDDGSDTYFIANAADTFTGDADTFDEFFAQLSPGDIVVHQRSGGEEFYDLDNEPPTTITGTLVESDPDGDPTDFPPSDDADGGEITMTLSNSTTEVTFTYQPGGTFLVDGLDSTEAEFEAALSAGDAISYRAADTHTDQTQRLEVTNAPEADEASGGLPF